MNLLTEKPEDIDLRIAEWRIEKVRAAKRRNEQALAMTTARTLAVYTFPALITLALLGFAVGVLATGNSQHGEAVPALLFAVVIGGYAGMSAAIRLLDRVHAPERIAQADKELAKFLPERDRLAAELEARLAARRDLAVATPRITAEAGNLARAAGWPVEDVTRLESLLASGATSSRA